MAVLNLEKLISVAPAQFWAKSHKNPQFWAQFVGFWANPAKVEPSVGNLPLINPRSKSRTTGVSAGMNESLIKEKGHIRDRYSRPRQGPQHHAVT